MQSRFCYNAVGTVLVIIALIIHVVCLAFPHYSQSDFSKMLKAANGGHFSEEESEVLKGFAENANCHWGFWMICFEISGEQSADSGCKMWNPEIASLTAPLKAARSLAILGAVILVKCSVGSVLTLIVASRGDRQKYLPYIICGFCFAGGFFSFVGDMVVAANYKAIKFAHIGERSEAFRDEFGDAFSLGWSFSLDLLVPILAVICGVCHLLGHRFYRSESDIKMSTSRLV